MKYPLAGRAVIIAVVALLILIPLEMVNGKIAERQNRAAAVEREFAVETAGPQTIVGPLLALTCEETVTDERQVMRNNKWETVTQKRAIECPTAYVTPRTLDVSGKVPVEQRYRGIYPIRLYRGALEVAGELAWPDEAAWNGINPRAYKQAYLVMAVGDTRGIRELSPVAWDGKAVAFATSGTAADPRFTLQASLGDYAARKPGDVVPFRFSMQLLGTSTLQITPSGDTTRIALASNWPHPSFTGAWRPDERRIGSDGFEATWRTTHYATGGRAQWEKQVRDSTIFANPKAAGVSFFNPIDVYSLSHRATEYGFLFVLFTFTALALAEVFADVRLHAVQYALIGSALAIFFLLLIALAEHIPFSAAYASAAGACVALLTFYLRHPLRTRARTGAFLALFTGLYAMLYFLLRSEDDALLMGTTLVFALLATVMVLTRKVDWAALSARMATGGAGKATPGEA